jgi:hypothetical protein
LTLTKSLADLFDLTTGFVSGIDLEMGYENRRPNDDGDESQFNPRYNMIRYGTILSTRPKWNFNVFYEAIITKDIENNYHFVGGEVAKKWDKINLHVGSSFIANKFETDSTGVVLEDSFYAQEYYFKVKWLPIKPLDVSLKTTFEVAKFSSFADDPVNGDVTGVGPDTIIEDPRHYLRFDLKVGYSFGSSRD